MTRQRTANRIAELLLSSASVALHAAPHMGKSWIADRVVEKLCERKTILIDCSALTESSQLLTEISLQLGIQLPIDSPSTQVWRSLLAQLERLEHEVTLVLDSFDAICVFSDATILLQRLRELLQRPKKYHLNCLFLSRRPMEAIEVNIRGVSVLASSCTAEYLRCIELIDLETWPKADSLEASDRDRCLVWSSGIPALVSYWLAGDAGADCGSVDADLRRLEVYDRMVRYLRDLSLLDACAQILIGPRVDRLTLEEMRLQCLGFIDIGEDSGSLGGSELFRQCIEWEARDMGAWGILGRAELALRCTIGSAMMEHYGEKWPSVVMSKSVALKQAHDRAVLARDKDLRSFGRSAEYLAYTYPSDLWEIIQSEWEHFKVVFTSSDKAYWKSRFSEFAKYRNPFAHNRSGEVLSTSDVLLARRVAEELVRVLEGRASVSLIP